MILRPQATVLVTVSRAIQSQLLPDSIRRLQAFKFEGDESPFSPSKLFGECSQDLSRRTRVTVALTSELTFMTYAEYRAITD